MKLIKTTKFQIELSDEQRKQLSSKEKIEVALNDKKIFSFEIYEQDNLIGFAMLRKYSDMGYFLWNYAIDIRYQNKGYGTKALLFLIDYFETKYNALEITTTYTYGNEIAKHIYEKIGFVETDIVDEDGIHEVNMIYRRGVNNDNK
ncbi:MAG: GNAT family N-acetyltransferase [Erysipelotrichaceae bacterium]|nr:GNAT family N-acetyltransferase [Erysipelotrichaceae bacterium]